MPVSKRTSEPTKLAPYWQSECGRAVVYVGDCREVMAQMDREQFHAVVTDPPYGLSKEPDVVEVMTSWIKYGHHEITGSGFMGKDWDAFVPQPATWQECVKVMKPGAYMLCFAGTRTLDWMGMSLRFVGLECRDLVMYLYGLGFPKGVNISKAIDRELGAERSKTRTPMSKDGSVWMDAIGATRPWKDKAKEVGYHEHDSSEPVTDEAARWQGWSTTLKPAMEPIILARKPMIGTVAQNTLAHECGGLNIDGCRIGTDQVGWGGGNGFENTHRAAGSGGMGSGDPRPVIGRWPANLILSHHPKCQHTDCHEDCPVRMVDEQSGSSKSTRSTITSIPGNIYGGGRGLPAYTGEYGFNDQGGASRFFYTTKADSDDRPHGKGKHVTTHPTVKPLDLMQYLVRLVCAPGGTVLDPFMGSGSTGCAAILEGMRFVGIELCQEYADIAVGRLKLALAEMGLENSPNTPATPSRGDATPPPPRRLRG